MLIIVATTLIAVALTYIIMKAQRADTSQLSQPRGELMTVGVQIICGDCSGEEERPHKTYLDRFGSCAQCGSHNYILASNRAIYAQELMAARMTGYDGGQSKARVLPFEVPTGSRSAKTEKIAV